MNPEIRARRAIAMTRIALAADAAAASAAWNLAKGAIAEIADPRVRNELLATAFHGV
jgi:hypothetical protein